MQILSAPLSEVKRRKTKTEGRNTPFFCLFLGAVVQIVELQVTSFFNSCGTTLFLTSWRTNTSRPELESLHTSSLVERSSHKRKVVGTASRKQATTPTYEQTAFLTCAK